MLAEVAAASASGDAPEAAMSNAVLPEAEKGRLALSSSNPMVGMPPPSPFSALCATASSMPHLADVRRSDQSVQEEVFRGKADEQSEVRLLPEETPSHGDAPRRSSASPQDSEPAPQNGAGTEPPVPLNPTATDLVRTDTEAGIAIITTLADVDAETKPEATKAPTASPNGKDDGSLSPSRRKLQPSEADEAAALALQAIFVAPRDVSRTHSPLQMLTAEVEKEKEQEEDLGPADATIADGDALPRAFEINFDTVADAAQVALLLAPDGVLSHEDLCVFIKHWGRLRDAQETYAVGKNWKRSLRNLMKKLSTFVSPSEDTWTLANPGAAPPPLYTETRRVSVPLASLRRIFPPISASPVVPRPPLLSQPRPKRQNTDLPTPTKQSRGNSDNNSDENIDVKEEEVDVVGSGDVKMREKPSDDLEPRSASGTPSRRSSGGKVSKAEMKELFENVSSPLVKANVRGIVNERTYATLSQEERATLERLLPSPDRNSDALVGILKGRNTFFNDSIVMYQNMLKSGAFDPFYADQRAMIRERKARERDPWKAANYEEHWGEQLLKRLWDSRKDGELAVNPAEAVELPPPPPAAAGASGASNSSLEDEKERDRKRSHRKKEPRTRAAQAPAAVTLADASVEVADGASASVEEDKEKWLACDQCGTWIIAATDGITDLTPYDETLTATPERYLCPLCRGEDRERAAKRAARKEVTSSNGGNGNKRSRDEGSSISEQPAPTPVAKVARAPKGEDEDEIELRS